MLVRRVRRHRPSVLCDQGSTRSVGRRGGHAHRQIITEYESEWLAKLKVELKGSIEKGINFVN